MRFLIKSYTMGREDKIMGKQWAFTQIVKIRNPQTLSTKEFAGIENGASNGT